MGDDRVCLHCGQTLPDAASMFDGLRLTPGQRRIAERVLRAGSRGISGRRLFDILYGDDPDGGPLSDMVTVRVRVYQLNRKLAAIGKEVRSEKGGRGDMCGTRGYVLRDVDCAGTWREMWSRPFVYPERL